MPVAQLEFVIIPLEIATPERSTRHRFRLRCEEQLRTLRRRFGRETYLLILRYLEAINVVFIDGLPHEILPHPDPW